MIPELIFKINECIKSLSLSHAILKFINFSLMLCKIIKSIEINESIDLVREYIILIFKPVFTVKLSYI